MWTFSSAVLSTTLAYTLKQCLIMTMNEYVLVQTKNFITLTKRGPNFSRQSTKTGVEKEIKFIYKDPRC